MRTQIKATNLSLTPDIESYVLKRATSLEKLIPAEDSSAMLAVEVGKTTAHHKSGAVFRAEFNLHIAHKHLYAVSEKEDLYAAIDEVKDELMHALRSHKDKELSLVRRGGKKLKDFVRGLYPRKNF